jgi:excisionase family DNA binding protein
MLKGKEPALDVFSAAEAAAEKGVHVHSLRRAIREGRLKAFKLGPVWGILRRDLDAWPAERGPQPKG